ncbi:uncharacterized protein LOC135384248 isoform X2 [Ornithodoros turicata]|uniref:uncharacterized protein LOC135384248 isoform X2 n=1 Tax=Ornithodoros turicata TaxID=34597 RepID=UPI0031396C23
METYNGNLTDAFWKQYSVSPQCLNGISFYDLQESLNALDCSDLAGDDGFPAHQGWDDFGSLDAAAVRRAVEHLDDPTLHEHGLGGDNSTEPVQDSRSGKEDSDEERCCDDMKPRKERTAFTRQQVKVWFQNRRMKWKRTKTTVLTPMKSPGANS